MHFKCFEEKNIIELMLKVNQFIKDEGLNERKILKTDQSHTAGKDGSIIMSLWYKD